MNIRKLLTLGLFLCISVGCMAADEDVKKQINSIKKSSQYIYGCHVAATKEEAMSMAEELLNDNINEWAATKKKMSGGNFNVPEGSKKDLMTTLSLPRGNMVMAFMYVKKSDIQALSSTKGGAAPVSTVTPVVQEKPTVTTPASTIPESKPVATPKTQTLHPDAVMAVAACKEYGNMVAKLKELKAAGKVSHYGRYKELDKKENYYLAIYNTAGRVVAVLTPGTTRKNVETGETDLVTNYSGCGAIGFSLK